MRTARSFYASDGSITHRERYGYGGSGIATDDYVYLEGEPVAIIRSTPTSASYFLHGDHLGRPIGMTSTTGVLLWRAEYEPFGKSLQPRVSWAPFIPGFRFPGQWESEESGRTGYQGKVSRLIDNWHRSYKPGWGRYSQPDPEPMLWVVHPDPFSYASSNPLRFTDRVGLYAFFPSCSGPVFGEELQQAAISLCTWGFKPGTKCERALRTVNLVRGGTSGGLIGCLQDACKGPLPVHCNPCQDACGVTQKGMVDTITIGGAGNPSCPRNSGFPIEATLFHETLHVCAFPYTEPDSGGLHARDAALFRYLERECYGWPAPLAPRP
jgi:RHS repeat-associated protein